MARVCNLTGAESIDTSLILSLELNEHASSETLVILSSARTHHAHYAILFVILMISATSERLMVGGGKSLVWRS